MKYEKVDASCALGLSSDVVADIQQENVLGLSERQDLLLRFGTQSSSYFNLQPNVQHFGIANVGFISYYIQNDLGAGVNFIFTNPVCSSDNLSMLLERFITSSSRKNIFFGVDKNTADALAEIGFSRNEIGPECWLPLQDFKISGKNKKYLRWARNMGSRGFRVKEQKWSEVDASAVKDITNQWLGNKATKHQELRLVTRPPEFGDAWEVRKFYCYKDGKLVGYVFFDPYFKDGKVIGYCANILRSYPDVKPNGFLDYTIITAMEIFRKEGIELFSLGIAPLYNVEKTTGEQRWLRRLSNFLFNYGNFIYSSKTLAYHKSRYRPEMDQWYCCMKDLNGVKATALIFLALNVI